MSDNLPPEIVQQELEARLRIPTEVWTDVFKLLPRRVLVTQVAPVCFYFKEISNKNVKTIHVIENAEEFTDKLDEREDDPVAIEELEHLAANDCQLAVQFQLNTNFRIWIREKSQAILRDCPDLFNKGSQITLHFRKNASWTCVLESLSHLENSTPFEIRVNQRVDQVIDYWHNPTFLNCTRVDLSFFSGLPAATVMNIFDWLHHQPNGVDCDGSAGQEIRCMIVWGTDHDHIDWLINRCSQNIQQCREPTDRRSYVFSFQIWNWHSYGQFRRIENNLSGEMLLLDRVVDDNGQPTREYRLRRCLAEEETNGEEFYARMFKPDRGFDEFNFDEKNKPRVEIL